MKQTIQPSEEEQWFVKSVISQLRNAMGETWDETWLEEMPVIEIDLLPLLLTRGMGAVQLEHMKRNFVGPMEESSKSIFRILESLPTEELELFMAGFAKLNNIEEVTEYFNNHLHINQVLNAENTESIIESADKIEPLVNEAVDLFRTYQETRDVNTLSQAISAWDNVINHPLFESLVSDKKANMLNNAGVAWRIRFDENHEAEDLYQSIRFLEMGSRLISKESPFLSAILTNLGPALFERFRIGGQKEDLDRAISTLRKAIELVGNITLENVSRLLNLGTCLAERFDFFGERDDLIASIQNYKMAEAVIPISHESYPIVLCNLGTSLMRQLETEKEPRLLNEAIGYLQKAEELTPKESYFLGEVLLNLGLGYSHRFELFDDLENLNQALDKLQRAESLMSKNPHKFSIVLSNLSNCYMNRYQRLGNSKDLDVSIEKAAQARSLSSHDNPGLSILLNTLGNGLLLRYYHRGNVADLDRATETLENALKVAQEKSPLWFLLLGNLGSCYYHEFQMKGTLRYLADAIGIEEIIVSNSSEDSPDYPNRLSNLASSFLSLHHYIQNLDSQTREEFTQLPAEMFLKDPLSQAIRLNRKALSLLPEKSPNHAGHLNGLATCLIELFRTDKNKPLPILKEAIDVLEQAISETSEEIPAKAGYYSNLASMIQERWISNGDARDLERARDAYKKACIHGISHSLGTCLYSGLNWGNWASKRGDWQEATDAYQYSISALDELIRIQMLRSGKELWIEDAKDLAAHAAYAHARLGNLETALLILEKGRTQLLSQSLALANSNLDSLQTTRPDLADSYYSIADKIWTLRSEELDLQITEDKELELNRANRDLENVIESIRKVNGYSNFLKPISLEEIRHAARRHPIIYLAVTYSGTLGIIVDNDRPLEVIWFDNLTSESLRSQLASYPDSGLPTGYFYTYDCWQKDQKNYAKKEAWQNDLDIVTEWLWRVLMGPLMKFIRPLGLSEFIILPQGRLNFLPIHASWTEDPMSPNGRQYALDKCTISYAANAQVLMNSYGKVEKLSTNKLLAISDPTESLEYAPQEVSIIEGLFKNETIYQAGVKKADRKTILDTLDQYDVLHFATHAQTDYKYPLESGLVLANLQILSLREILKKKLPRTRLAVLSACETGFPSVKTPDELLSLPMGMMEAGVPGIIASLWPVDDISTMLLMVYFYDLWRSRGMTPRDALHQSQIWLRDTSADAIIEYIQSLLADLGEITLAENFSEREFLQRLKWEIKGRHFGHPYYWAGFLYIGI